MAKQRRANSKENSKENSFCFVFVTLRGKFILCYFVYAYMSLVKTSWLIGINKENNKG